MDGSSVGGPGSSNQKRMRKWARMDKKRSIEKPEESRVRPLWLAIGFLALFLSLCSYSMGRLPRQEPVRDFAWLQQWFQSASNPPKDVWTQVLPYFPKHGFQFGPRDAMADTLGTSAGSADSAVSSETKWVMIVNNHQTGEKITMQR